MMMLLGFYFHPFNGFNGAQIGLTRSTPTYRIRMLFAQWPMLLRAFPANSFYQRTERSTNRIELI